MNDQDKTREELKKELLELRQEHDELRKSYEKDIAERIQTEKDLRVSRLRFSDIITNLDEAYYSCELDGTLLEHNIAFKRIFGFDPNQDMKGIKISDLWQNPKERTEYLSILMNEGFIRNYLVDTKARSGEKTVVMVNSHLVKDGNGKVVRIEGTLADFTERVQVEKKLEESETQFRQLFENMSSGVAIYEVKNDGNDFIFKNFNHAAEKIENIKREKVIGENVLKIFPGVREFGIYEVFQRVWKTGKPEDHPISFYQDERIASWRENYVYKLPKGEIVAIYNDITGRKQAEEALKKSQLLLMSSIESQKDTILFSIDQNYRYLYFNKAHLDVMKYAYNKDVKLGMNILECITSDDDRKAAKDNYDRALEGESHSNVRIFGDVGLAYYESFFNPIVNDNNEIIGATGLARNITDRKQSEDLLEQSHKLLFKLSEQVPGVIYQYRLYPDGRSCFPYSSSGMKEIYEVSSDEVREDATTVFGRLHPDDLERVSELIFESARTLQHFHCEFRVVLPRQGLRWRYSDAMPERMEDSGTLWHGIIYDITDRKQTEHELIKAKEHAEESDRLKSAFLSNMSHEIRTPMNGILGFAGLLKEPNLTGEEQQKYIRIIEKSGARMLNIINDIISISKIESGQMETSISEMNVNESIEYVYNFFLPEVERKGIQLYVKNTLPSIEAIIKTDREKVYAILTNLVKNAIKYTNKGSLEFGYEKKGRYFEFFVKDTGIGVAKDRLEAIFERFIQADISDKRAYEGAGLGLSISKAYVEILGGKIWVESEFGKGSIFYFTIPCNAGPEEISVIPNIVPAEDEEVQINNLKILIAEDDETSEMLIAMIVKLFGKDFLKVRTGIEAVEVCRNNPDIDLVLMDIRMPEMNGYEATTQIRQFNKDVIIIAQTSYGLSDDREKAIEAGCSDYISKPIDRNLLMGIIQKYFKK
jgi:PAS domain S-box-containing protein